MKKSMKNRYSIFETTCGIMQHLKTKHELYDMKIPPSASRELAVLRVGIVKTLSLGLIKTVSTARGHEVASTEEDTIIVSAVEIF